MTPSARRDAILHKARSGQKLEVEALALQFAESRETIRRDLAKLDRQGLLRRVHGGATATGRAVDEGPFHDRMRQQVAAKRAIARHVASGLMPGDSLFIDTGSTTLILAEEIAQRKGLIIITNSADIAALCEKGEGNRVLLIGGEFRAAGRETVGPLAGGPVAPVRAGGSKMGRTGVFEVCPMAKVGRIVTDSLPLLLRRAIEAVGVQVEIVNDL